MVRLERLYRTMVFNMLYVIVCITKNIQKNHVYLSFNYVAIVMVNTGSIELIIY